jgi:putative transposase
VIRDERDLKSHFDYIHWNPVKHRYVLCPEEWSQSTFLHWMRRGYYELGWGHSGEPTSIVGVSLE